MSVEQDIDNISVKALMLPFGSSSQRILATFRDSQVYAIKTLVCPFAVADDLFSLLFATVYPPANI